MANQPIPDASEPFVLKDGTINPVWYRFLRDLARLLRDLARRIAALE